MKSKAFSSICELSKAPKLLHFYCLQTKNQTTKMFFFKFRCDDKHKPACLWWHWKDWTSIFVDFFFNSLNLGQTQSFFTANLAFALTELKANHTTNPQRKRNQTNNKGIGKSRDYTMTSEMVKNATLPEHWPSNKKQ